VAHENHSASGIAGYAAAATSDRAHFELELDPDLFVLGFVVGTSALAIAPAS
jgi:hypothetical protein